MISVDPVSRLPFRALVISLALTLGLSPLACGSGSSESTGAGPARQGADEVWEQPSAAGKREGVLEGGSEQFETRDGDNSIQRYGAEASGSDLEDATGALQGYLDARAAGSWSGACQYLAREMVSALIQQLGPGQPGRPTCAKLLAGLSADVPQSVLRESAIIGLGALRVDGRSAFLLFRGARGADFFIPMRRQDGVWKVAAIAPSALL